MALDLSQLSSLQALVRSHSISDDSERTTMRSFADLKDGRDLIAESQIGCDPVKKANVRKNMMGNPTQRIHYRFDC